MNITSTKNIVIPQYNYLMYGPNKTYSVSINDSEEILFHLKHAICLPAILNTGNKATEKGTWGIEKIFLLLSTANITKAEKIEIQLTSCFYSHAKEELFLSVNDFIAKSLFNYIILSNLPGKNINIDACQKLVENVLYVTRKAKNLDENSLCSKIMPYRAVVDKIQLTSSQWNFNPPFPLDIHYDDKENIYYGCNTKLGYRSWGCSPDAVEEEFIDFLAWKYLILVFREPGYTYYDGQLADILEKRLTMKDIPAKSII